jgi:hypothetical protein
MKTEINTKIKVFPQLYVGLKAQYDYDLETKQRTQRVNLGFATPLEKNAAFEKRKRTVDYWAQPQSDYDLVTRKSTPGKQIPAVIVDNVPVSGFKITDDVRRIYWGGGNVVWRVEDPRGFELEMSSQNLMAIIQTVGISAGGEIPGKCVWARDGANNVLLHESTEEFKTAFQVGRTVSPLGTKLLPEHVGCRVSFKSGYAGTYLGGGSCFSWNSYDKNTVFRHTYMHFFLNPDGKHLTTYLDPKPVLIEKDQELTDVKALKKINQLRDKIVTAGTSSYGTRYTEVARSKKFQSLELKLGPVTLELALSLVEVTSDFYHTHVGSKSPTILLGRSGTRLYLLSRSGHDMRVYGRGGLEKVSLECVTLESDRIVQSGDQISISLPPLPERCEQNSTEMLRWREEATRQLLRAFDSLAVIDPVITY